MKLTIEEMDTLIKGFVANNKEYLMSNVDNMETLPEVVELFSNTGWTMDEYHTFIREHQEPLETLVEQLLQLGVTEEELADILKEYSDILNYDK